MPLIELTNVSKSYTDPGSGARVPVLRLLRRLLIVVLGIVLIGILGMWVLTPAGRKVGLFSPAETSVPVELALLADSGARASHPDAGGRYGD